MDQELVGRIDTDDTDFQQVRAALAILKVPPAQFPALLTRLLAEAKSVLQQRMGELTEVADLLIEHKKLSRSWPIRLAAFLWPHYTSLIRLTAG